MSLNAFSTYSPRDAPPDIPFSLTIGTFVAIALVWCMIASFSCILCYKGQEALDWIGACCGGDSNHMGVRRRKEIIVTPLTAQQKALIGEFVHHEPTEEGSIVSEDSSCSHSSLADCSICLSCFAEGEVCRSLPAPCGHMFHKSCIDQWFETSSRCPLCNRSVPALIVMRAEGSVENDQFSMVKERDIEAGL